MAADIQWPCNNENVYKQAANPIKRARKKMMPDNMRRYEFITKIIPQKTRVLEIGSGHGFFLEIMKTNGFDIIGFDISKEKRKYSKKISNIPVYDININEKIPTVDKFDIVVLSQSVKFFFTKNVFRIFTASNK